ncbi:MAG: flagellar basal-body rod protein FlgG [Bdellovibrionaceae bacterium]|nr:flagellar basal-body rod protein FlgG [Pseudobdellovibrionaceae bacterium]
MIKALNTAATGMQAQQTNMDVISNNLANVSTAGFKKSRAEFEDLMYQNAKDPGAATGLNSVSPTGVQTGLGVRTAAIQRDMSFGNSSITKNPLDMQIEGAGFFQVLTPDGQVGFTRDGQFKKDAQGRIVDKNANVLQPEITIPPDASGIEISSSGEVRVTIGNTNEVRQIGQIDIVNFVNPTGLKSMGKNIYTSTPASGQPITVRPGLQGTGYLAQGQIESSNVNIVDEMVNMITAQRAYETNSKAIQAADQMLQTVNSLR